MGFSRGEKLRQVIRANHVRQGFNPGQSSVSEGVAHVFPRSTKVVHEVPNAPKFKPQIPSSPIAENQPQKSPEPKITKETGTVDWVKKVAEAPKHPDAEWQATFEASVSRLLAAGVPDAAEKVARELGLGFEFHYNPVELGVHIWPHVVLRTEEKSIPDNVRYVGEEFGVPVTEYERLHIMSPDYDISPWTYNIRFEVSKVRSQRDGDKLNSSGGTISNAAISTSLKSNVAEEIMQYAEFIKAH